MPEAPKNELSMEMRLLLAFLLMGAVMFVTQLWFKPQQPAPVEKRAEPSASIPKANEPPSPAAAKPPATTAEAAPSTPPAGATPQQPQPAIIVDTDLFRVVLNNQGANVRSWQLKKYRGNDNQPLELVNEKSGLEFPFSLFFPSQKPANDVNWAWH